MISEGARIYIACGVFFSLMSSLLHFMWDAGLRCTQETYGVCKLKIKDQSMLNKRTEGKYVACRVQK